jgi:hypothetical protein
MPSPDGATLIAPGGTYLDDASALELSRKLTTTQTRWEKGQSYCARNTSDFLRDVGLRSGVSGTGAGGNARELGGILKTEGWTEIKINKPEDAPINSVVTATNIYRGGPKDSVGHANIRVPNGFLKTGQGGGLSGTQKSFGPVKENEDVYAYIPPESAVKKILPNAVYNRGKVIAASTEKGMDVNPSADKPTAFDLNNWPDLSLEGSEQIQNEDTVSLEGLDEKQKNEVLYMMRVAASESAAGVGDSQSIINNLNDPLQRVGYANGFSSGSETALKLTGQNVISGGKFTDGAYRGKDFSWDLVDIGFLQTNPQNSKDYGFVNSGSYANQVAGSVSGLKNYLKTRRDGKQVLAAIQSGDFVTADAALDNFWFGLGRKSGKADIAELEKNIKTKYGNDPIAALNGINNDLSGGTLAVNALATSVGSVATVQHPSQSFTDNRDSNNMPTGMFGSARIGQLVWVFFQEGNPLFPVYFAASYGQTEWANAQMHSSPDKIKESGGAQSAIHLDGGYISSTQIVGGNAGFANDAFSMSVGGKNGSNLNFTEHTTHLFSKYDFRGHTQCDHHSIVGGNREVRTVGDHNMVIEQDFILTVGNWGKEALDAAAEIQNTIEEAMNAAKDAIES